MRRFTLFAPGRQHSVLLTPTNLVWLVALSGALGCSGDNLSGVRLDGSLRRSPMYSETNGIIHHASVGGPDTCEAFGLGPGCDANFSLVANQRADGTVTGQWQDSFGPPNDPFGGGIHVNVDCMVNHGNKAVVGGVISHGTGIYRGLGGRRAVTLVVDNDASAPGTPDQHSISIFPGGPGLDCSFDPALFPIFDLRRGQVEVW